MTTTTQRRLPPDPRTVAEMIPVREAEIAARPVPECHVLYHGTCAPRPLDRQTYETMWCGVWYDCQSPRCSTSVTYASRELAASHGEPYNTGSGYEIWDGERWQPISEAENQRLFDERQAERERRDAEMLAAARKRKPARKSAAEIDKILSGAAHATWDEAGRPDEGDTAYDCTDPANPAWGDCAIGQE